MKLSTGDNIVEGRDVLFKGVSGAGKTNPQELVRSPAKRGKNNCQPGKNHLQYLQIRSIKFKDFNIFCSYQKI